MIAKTRKASRSMAALLAATMVVTASPIDASAAKAPAWKAKKTTMTEGQKYTFKVKNIPSKGKVKFSSSKVKVATVSSKGVVKAKKAGKTVIKAVVMNKKNKKVKTLKVNLNVKAAVPTVTPTATVVTTPSVEPVATPTVVPSQGPTVAPTATPVISNNDKNWALVIEAKESSITADGGDNTVLTFKMINTTTQKADETANDITLNVTSSFGELSNETVTIKKGVGTLVLNSEFSAKELDCKIYADISRQSSNATDLVGKVTGETHVTFEPFKIAEDKNPKLVKAESDQADRVTLFFDREVKIEDFVVKNEATGTYSVVEGKQVFLNTSATRPVFTVSQEDVNGKTVSYSIVGMAEVKNDDGTRTNTKALQLILDENVALDDNNKVTVNYTNMPCGMDTKTTFILTDAKKPQFTAIEAIGMKKVKITFSEAIPEKNNSTNAGYTINGSTYSVGKVDYGTYNPATAEDNRSVVVLTLGKDDKLLQQYFKAGTAILGLTNVIDYAGITDLGKNIISNQNKEFEIEEDANIPTAKVTVESPEQYRIKFTGDKNKEECPVVFTKDKNKTQEDITTYFTKALKVKVGTKYVSMFDAVYTLAADLELGSEDGKKVKPVLDATLAKFLNVTKVSDSEYVVELTQDWTKFYTTSLTSRNFYNDAYQFVFEEDTIYNDNNGLTNLEDIVLDLNYEGSPMNQQDDSSPVVEGILRTDDDNYFAAKMSEPVQFTTTDGDSKNITLSEDQSAQPAKAEFKGTDENGEIVTFYGKVMGYYGNEKKTDTLVQLEAVYTDDKGNKYTIQQLVDLGYGTDWTVALTYVYDDVKNAAETKVARFEVQPTSGLFAIQDVTGVTAATSSTTSDTITVRFTQGISDIADALDITRWKLDGYSFPENSVLEVIKDSGNAKVGYYSVRFTVPKGTIRKGKSHVLNVDKGIKSIKENTLIGSYENKFVAQ